MGNPTDPAIPPQAAPLAPQAAPVQPVAQPVAPQAAGAANPPQAQTIRRTSTIITNPKPLVDEKPVEHTPAVPQSTLDEMAAGQAALKRNAPTAAALEAAAAARKKAEEA